MFVSHVPSSFVHSQYQYLRKKLCSFGGSSPGAKSVPSGFVGGGGGGKGLRKAEQSISLKGIHSVSSSAAAHVKGSCGLFTCTNTCLAFAELL